MIYALIGSAVLYWLIFTGAVFLFLWVPSRDFMMLVLGWGLGLGVTILAKMLLTSIPRASYQAAFYRKKPKYANFVMLGLECWNIGLGAGVMLGRLLQFLFAAAFWIGRTDAKFLDEDVQLFGYYFDYIPMNFRKDILVHEAHRHPWIQRIGVMAMMRLRHGPSFGGKAGACWRRIFVAALFPWLLSKYQNSSKKTSQVEDILSSHQGESRDASMVAEDGDDQEWYLKSI